MTTLEDSVEKAKQILIDAAAEITEVLNEDFSTRFGGDEMPRVLKESLRVLLEENMKSAMLVSLQEILGITREMRARSEQK